MKVVIKHVMSDDALWWKLWLNIMTKVVMKHVAGFPRNFENEFPDFFKTFSRHCPDIFRTLHSRMTYPCQIQAL